jgi:hypothetical protein
MAVWVLRRSGGVWAIGEVEVWMDGRMECRVLRRSGGDSEEMELELELVQRRMEEME